MILFHVPIFLYIHDVLSLNNSMFGEYVDHIYLIEHEIKDTTDIEKFEDSKG